MDKKRIAAIVTEYRPRSHADVIVTKYLKGFPTDEGLLPPRVQVASLYIDQFPDSDIGRDMAAAHGVPLFNSIPAALCLGGKELAVDGVLLIGEHGDYAWNEKEQHLYPRRHFMEQICGVMAAARRSVPVFNDKHLGPVWNDARWMYDRARELQAPFMAGSSLPVAWRKPWLEHDMGTQLEHGVAVGFSGLDIYGAHTLETLQCMVERRHGGECGVTAVTCLEGDGAWRAMAAEGWIYQLAEAACAEVEEKPAGKMEEHCNNPVLFRIEYRDGFQAAVLMLNGYIQTLAYAARVDGDTVACEFRCQGHGGQEGAYAHFSYLGLNVEEMFVTGRPSYPVERTLLTTGMLDAALTSRHQGYTRLETPWLDIDYQPAATIPWRPTGQDPTGACLDPWPPR